VNAYEEGASAASPKRWLFYDHFRGRVGGPSRLPMGVAADALRPIFAG